MYVVGVHNNLIAADDFKPQSVDSTKPGHLQVTDDEVDVSLPVVGQVRFGGNNIKLPCTCI